MWHLALLITTLGLSFRAQADTSCSYRSPPPNTVCGQQGTLTRPAPVYKEVQIQGGGACGGLCSDDSACRAAQYSEKSGISFGLCDLYNKTLAQMGFTPGPNQPGNGVTATFYGRACFSRPSACSFRLTCDGACSGLYLAAGAIAGGPYYPTALVPNPNEGPRKRTNFTVQTGMRWSIVQGGKRYFASVPAKDSDTASSVISFRPQAALDNGEAKALSCVADLMSPFRCSAGAAGSNKNLFFACPSSSSSGFKHLEISRVDQAGKGGCAGGQRMDLRYVDYQPGPD